jgi:hypothetical protein
LFVRGLRAPYGKIETDQTTKPLSKNPAAAVSLNKADR